MAKAASGFRKTLARLQLVLPHHGLSRLAGRFADARHPGLVRVLIRGFNRVFGVDWTEAAVSDPDDYPTLNALFTRSLRSGARPVCPRPNGTACPADGTLSGFGHLAGNELVQAKDRKLDVTSLLGGDPERAKAFRDGSYLTVYLAPPDYHRVHMPVTGTLTEMVHVPGRIFSVGPATAEAVSGLLARNERVVALFRTQAGPMALILVGAMLVASIQVRWHGTVTPAGKGGIRHWSYPRSGRDTWTLQRGQEVGRFRLGSTVIALFPAATIRWDPELAEGQHIRMGECLGDLEVNGSMNRENASRAREAPT